MRSCAHVPTAHNHLHLPAIHQITASKAITLSLRLKRLCDGQGADALAPGRCVPAVVKSVEDHVYTLGFGIKVRLGVER